jgi:hypothetical protein
MNRKTNAEKTNLKAIVVNFNTSDPEYDFVYRFLTNKVAPATIGTEFTLSKVMIGMMFDHVGTLLEEGKIKPCPKEES